MKEEVKRESILSSQILDLKNIQVGFNALLHHDNLNPKIFGLWTRFFKLGQNLLNESCH